MIDHALAQPCCGGTAMSKANGLIGVLALSSASMTQASLQADVPKLGAHFSRAPSRAHMSIPMRAGQALRHPCSI